MPLKVWSTKKEAIYHLLSLLGGQHEVKGFRDYFQFERPYKSHRYYVTLDNGHLAVVGNAYYIHPHNRDQNWSGEKQIPLPEDAEEKVYRQLRADVIAAFQDQIEAEKREASEKKELGRLLSKYGVPEDYDGEA